MISLTEAEQFEYPEQEIDKPLKHITLSEADSIESYKFKPFEYERGAVTKFATGVVDTIRDMQDLPEQLSIFGNRLSYGYGGYFGDTEEETERKKQNLLTAERNLEASQRERYRFTSGKEQESIAYGVGSGAVSYGTMLISSGLAGGVAKAVGMGAKAVGAAAEVGGLGAMGVMELAGQVQDKTPTKDGQIDAEAMTPEWARRVTNGTVIYTALSGLTEKYVGFGRQLKMWEKPISWGNSFTSNILTGIKSGVKSGLSEGLTEGIQDLEATGIGLLDGSVRLADLQARIQQAWKSAIIGGIIGTSAGTAVAIKSGRNVRKQLRDMVYPVVGNMDEAQSIADAIYQSGTDEMTKVMSIELELSSELKNKHGKVWNSMLAAVDKAVAASGSARFKNMTEEERAEYVNTAAKSFADQVLAEAHHRGTTIDALIKDTDIVYDKGLRIKRNINVYDALKNPEMIPPETKLKRTSLIQYLRSRGGVQDVGGDLKSRGAIKEAPGLISKKGMGLDDAALSAWEQGYFPEFVERPTINDLLNAIDDELRGKKRYNVEEEATFEDELADLAEGLDRMGIDWRNMQPAEIEQAVEEYPELQRLEKELQFYDEFEYDLATNVTGMTDEELEAYDERLGVQLYQLADEMASLDAENPIYEGETININGQEKTVYNSNGDRIAKSKEVLENFYRWFGNSKVVDEQGRPLSLFRGDLEDIEIFDESKQRGGNLGRAFYFTTDKEYARQYSGYNETGREPREYYLKLNNPLIVGKDGYVRAVLNNFPDAGNLNTQQQIKEFLRDKGIDGVIWDRGNKVEYAVYSSNQIKSTQNRGTYSESDENIYYQNGEIDLNINTRENEFKRLEKMQEEYNVGENLQDRNFDEWVEEYFTKKEEKRIDEMDLYDAEALLEDLEDANEKIKDDPEYNEYDRKSPFTEEEFIEYAKDIMKHGIDESVRETINSLSSYDYDNLREEFSGGRLNREIFFDDYQDYVAGIMEDNGFYVDKDNSRVSDSRYIDVYESEEVYDDGGEPFSKIRISDHDTHKFYGHHINLYTNRPIGEEINKLKNAFSNGDFGIDRTVYYQKRKEAKGVTKITPDAYIINLLENADESTLPHEFAHYWLSNMWNYVRSGRASESYMNRWNTIADYLGVKPEQTSLKRGQQEKFASSYEAYLTRGDLPTPAIQSAFDDYDKWLQRVYKDYNKINYQSGMGRRRVRLTDAAVKFFQSMTSGVLEAPALAPVDTGVRLEEMRAPEVISDNAVVEVPTMVDTTRVVNITEGEKGVSKIFQREGMINADRIVDELGVEYHKINLEDQAIKATEWVRNNLEEARKVVNGAHAPEGIIDTAIFIAYENEMLRIGNNAEYTRALKIHSQVQTQRGQAIAAERIATNNMTTPAYWLEKVINNREQGLADRLFKGDVKKLRNLITDETKKAAKEVLGKSREEQREYLQKLADRLRKENNVDTLYQLPDEELDKDNVINVIHNFLEEAMGVTVTQEESDALINKAEQLKKVWDNTLDKNGNPSVEGWRTLAEMNKTVEAMSPSHIMTVMSSIYGRSAMLASVKSPTLNIMSNLQNFITEGIVRRFTMGKDKSVNKDAIKEYMKYSWETYNASGFIVSGMQDVSEEIVTLGESRPTTQGRGKLRKIAQVSENIVFKYLMGAPDAVTKDLNFVDTADLLATKIAKDEGAKDISARSTEIFRDAILINPETEQGKQVRAQAIEQAHIATYTNNSKISDFSLKARQWLNMIGGNKFKLGDVVMPFVKTPANVQMMGLEYGFGSLYTLYKINDIMRNPASEISQRAIKAAYRNGVGLFLAMMIAAAFDPDDYIPEFDNATTKDRELAKAKNAPFNSIKIGNKWVSLDYFGPLGIPLVAVLNARKGRNLTDQITNFVKAGIGQGMKIPGIKEGLAIWDSLSRTAAYSTTPEKAFDMVSNALLDQVRARTIPAIVNDVAKIMDEYERDTSGSVLDKVQASIPFLREQLPQRYTISGKPLKTEGAASILFFGGRVKTAEDNKLVKEINKLSKKEEQPSISDVTRYGDLRLLSPEKKIKARRDFYKEYAKESKKLISSSSYKKLDAGDKKKALDKIRRNIVKDLKEKYAKDIKREKRRR